MTRIAVGGFQHETNTFSPIPGTWEVFLAPDGWPGLTRGPAVFDALRGYNIAMAGLLDGALAHGFEVTPLAWCGGGASGTVTADAFEAISTLLLDELEAALPIDGLLLDLHGAMVADHVADGDGEFLRRVRTLTGPQVPVVCSLDLHANLTPAMVELSDELLVYRTYPHLDMAATGRRAADRLARILKGDTAPQRAFRQIPFLIPLTRGCTWVEPAQTVYQTLATLESQTAVTHLSFACGFSSSDVPHCGPAIVGYGADARAVQGAVDQLYHCVLAREEAFALDLWTVADAVERALEMAARGMSPVVLADVDDNAGAGHSSDTTWILAELAKRGVQNAGLGVIHDPAAAAAAHGAGVGATLTLGLGGKAGLPGHRPQWGDYRVEALSPGRFQTTGDYFAGAAMDLGPMAVLRLGGIQIVVASRREQAADQAMFTHLGVDPAAAAILVLKSSVHYRADFQPLAASILEVGAPDQTHPLPYRHLRPGLRPLPGMPPRGNPQTGGT
ncbi:MAG: M81 family metallopeptidase [Candidatus Competibacterales bacterium]